MCQVIRKVCFLAQTLLRIEIGGVTMRSVLLDKLLSYLDIHVEPFSLCDVSPRHRLRLPGSPRVMPG